MLGPTTAASEAAGRLSSAAACPTMPAIMPRQPACTAAKAGPAVAAGHDDDRHAVGVADREAEAGRRGQQAVVLADHRLAVEGAAPGLGLAHPGQRRAVDLAGHDEPLVRQAEGGAQPPPVLEHALAARRPPTGRG